MKNQTQKPKLEYFEFYEFNNLKMTVEISLSDDCNNGNADFSLTCSAKEYYNGKWEDSFAGCCPEEILKHFPGLKIFADLHLADQNGVPMYAVENGFYHAYNEEKTPEDRQQITCEYLRIIPEEYKKLTQVKTKLYFRYMLYNMGIVERWKEEAEKAITILEEMTGKKWDYTYNWTREGIKPLTAEEKKDLDEKIKTGYYTPEQTRKREQQRQEEISST